MRKIQLTNFISTKEIKNEEALHCTRFCTAFGAVNAEETDLVVVGSGGAGLSAAIMAAQQGKKLLFSKKCRSSAETLSAVRAV